MTDIKLNEIEGNAWNYDRRNFDVRLCITTNGTIVEGGRIVTGAGIAQEATERYPSFPYTVGRFVKESGLHVYYAGNGLISFPVKFEWFGRAYSSLIAQSLQELMLLTQLYGWKQVLIPRPGCGNGQLTWPDVKRLIEHVASRDAFSAEIVCQKFWFITNFSVERQLNKAK